jgi:hypothetical protein
MPKSRLDLHTLLKTLVGPKGMVYFQPPSADKMVYPCIVYARNNGETKFAGNLPYIFEKRYTITVMDKDPDSEIPDKLAKLPLTSFDRHFTVDNLNHDVFTMYY